MTLRTAGAHPCRLNSPVETCSGELAEVAAKWLKNTPPAEFNQSAIQGKRVLLQKESAALDPLIRMSRIT